MMYLTPSANPQNTIFYYLRLFCTICKFPYFSYFFLLFFQSSCMLGQTQQAVVELCHLAREPIGVEYMGTRVEREVASSGLE